MYTRILDGSIIASKIIKKIKKKVTKEIKLKNRIPGLAVIWMGNQKPSQLYVKKKKKFVKK